MYVPAHFKEDRVAVLHDAIRTYGFGTLVTSSEQELEASHLPLLLDPEPAPLGTVLGHLARANPQWTRVKPGFQALAIFLGPNTYITPSWYPTKQQTGKVVPTWIISPFTPTARSASSSIPTNCALTSAE